MRSSSQRRVIEAHLFTLLAKDTQAMILQCWGIATAVHMGASS